MIWRLSVEKTVPWNQLRSHRVGGAAFRPSPNFSVRQTSPGSALKRMVMHADGTGDPHVQPSGSRTIRRDFAQAAARTRRPAGALAIRPAYSSGLRAFLKSAIRAARGPTRFPPSFKGGLRGVIRAASVRKRWGIDAEKRVRTVASRFDPALLIHALRCLRVRPRPRPALLILSTTQGVEAAGRTPTPATEDSDSQADLVLRRSLTFGCGRKKRAVGASPRTPPPRRKGCVEPPGSQARSMTGITGPRRRRAGISPTKWMISSRRTHFAYFQSS